MCLYVHADAHTCIHIKTSIYIYTYTNRIFLKINGVPMLGSLHEGSHYFGSMLGAQIFGNSYMNIDVDMYDVYT